MEAAENPKCFISAEDNGTFNDLSVSSLPIRKIYGHNFQRS
jgi:hypothetical protein